MLRLPLFAALILTSLLTTRIVHAHCQVPCGIYGDQRRFEELLEDTRTITKAMVQINSLHSQDDALSHNQLTRWVVTKEDHATNIQRVIADYFMAQRIKPDSDNYAKQLMAAHGVMVAAMKCKQNVDSETAKSLEKAIFDLYRAYEGKEPVFEHTSP